MKWRDNADRLFALALFLVVALVVLGILCLPALGQTKELTAEQRAWIAADQDMSRRYNQMLKALQDLEKASNEFAAIHNQQTRWPSEKVREVEDRMERFARAWQKVKESQGWLSPRK